MYKHCSPACKYRRDLFLSAYIAWVFSNLVFQNIFKIIHKNRWRHWFLMNINEKQLSKTLKSQQLSGVIIFKDF